MVGEEDFAVEEIAERLVREFGYRPWSAELVAQGIKTQMAPAIRTAFVRWWRGGPLETPEVEGYTVQRLMQERGMNPINAFRTLDWLRREPDEAKDLLSRRVDEVL